MRDLVIVGAGGFARETAAAVAAINAVSPTWRLRGFLDDDPALHGTRRVDVPVIGGTDLVGELADAAVVVCVGNPRNYRSRQRLVERFGLPPQRYATIVHPSARVGVGCVVGEGSVLLAGVDLTAEVSVGAHVAVMPQVVLTHDNVIGPYATIASGVRLGGGVRLGDGVYVGAGALLRDGVSVGAWSQLGMGSVALRDVPAGEVWVGAPARFLRPAGQPAGPQVESKAVVAVEESSVNSIPLVDLAAAHAEVAEEVDAGFKRVIADTAFIGGAEVAAFEAEYAAFSGVPHCVGVANGTDALELALRAVGVGPGSEVILPANTFIATAEAVARAGARVVLVDCDPATYLIDVDAALAAVTPATRAIAPVHLYGQLADVQRLRAGLAGLAGGTGRDVAIVEDAAQCQGATRHGVSAGADGIAATSFYPGKNLGAYGDAGAVVTADAGLAADIRLMSAHGSARKYVHEVLGFNSRLDGLQAVVLRAKLARLADGNARRRAIAARYDELLADLDVVRPVTADGNVHVWHIYCVRVPGGAARRDAVVAALNTAGIGAGIHYPVPVHLTPAFADLGYPAGSFPHAESTAPELLSVPIYPQLTAAQQDRVVEVLAAALAG
ncbi:NeuD/PglB/VioB family sugar acetyltransferase [Solwaraspora sp. WMMD406]|uniref:NeuD/PglB/VioB family sugar acetyltransferase n=1 Tax=Solwaraspora sp. WMMD406 TaxID=3016095 RepID=UPI002416D73B|nr:NeuD/PglB/VioB family sugar acetyltransferase [Solwaraspora sp. WMMD406]MDG4764277.1 NeuD/PglB/VioB family sugar acetyltransferase [Solwaraspora sp. WMMD406]